MSILTTDTIELMKQIKERQRYVRVGAGPALGGKGVRVVLRKLHGTEEITVTYNKFKDMEYCGLIEIPAFIPKEKR